MNQDSSSTVETSPQPPEIQPVATPAPRMTEFAALFLAVLTADVAIYRGGGFTGWGVFFSVVAALLWLGRPTWRWHAGIVVTLVMLVMVSVRLIWCGSWLLVGCGGLLLAAFGMSLAGVTPFLVELVSYVAQLIPAGTAWLRQQSQLAKHLRIPVSSVGLLSVIIPATAVSAFSLLFVLANPDFLSWLGNEFTQWFERLRQWLFETLPQPVELAFCAVVAWLMAGMLRPMLPAITASRVPKSNAPPTNDAMYPVYRNTLAAVSALFFVYLIFEFKTLWFRKFPVGFHYSGYAHEGAAWLTVALALATVVLSLVFRGEILADPRVAVLRRWAWLWSLLNFVLVIAVFHRMSIYIGFNGMTRMRVVGIFGISTVAVGFAIVVWKIARQRDFLWLVRRQLWALALAVYLYAITPVDVLTMQYNVQRILAGDPAPCVQISVHPLNAEGVVCLLPLAKCEHPEIREGVRALLAKHDLLYQDLQQAQLGWTFWQFAERHALQKFETERTEWEMYRQKSTREKQLSEFHKYAYQWY